MLGLTMVMLGSVAAAAPQADDPPAPRDQSPEIDRWAAAAGLRLDRYNRILVSPQGVFYGNRTIAPKNQYIGTAKLNPGRVNSFGGGDVRALRPAAGRQGAVHPLRAR